jgi:very-long-chain enoyl-CoA reductase
MKSSESNKYVSPRGGLFAYVATPHYLFELIGWLGIAIVANHLNSYLVFAGMCSYLAGRSVAQNEFNREKFDDWSTERKNLIPFVF